MTFEEIFELFEDYLKSDLCVEVIHTKWGYVRLFFEYPYPDTIEAVLCPTAEELFNELLDDYLTDQEYQLVKMHGSLTRKGRRTLEKLRKDFQRKAGLPGKFSSFPLK